MRHASASLGVPGQVASSGLDATSWTSRPTSPPVRKLPTSCAQGEEATDTWSDVRTLNDTRVGIETNAAWTGTIAGLVTAPGTWEQCLQGYGPFTKNGGGVC